MKEDIKRRIDIAAGREMAEVVLKNCRVVNVFSHEIIEGDIAIDSGKIIGVGQYTGKEEIDIKWKYVSPGLIDSHVHIESSMSTPGQFAREVVPRGTTTVIADPHEIANVCGIDGIKYLLEASSDIPLNVFVMLPSCVPATGFENSGAVLEADELKTLLNEGRVLGLGELMNYPGTIAADDKILDKIEIMGERVIDGHGPGITGKELNAYVAAGVRTEHECTTTEEMINRLRLGMYILIRQGTAAQNLEVLIRALNKDNIRRCLFCTDDKHPGDIVTQGHINYNLKLAVKGGIDPISAIQMATINAAECYRLKGIGAIAPGYNADLIIIDNFEDFKILKVFKDGKMVARNCKPLFNEICHDYTKVTNTVKIKKIDIADFSYKINSDIVNVIRVVSHSLVTERVTRKVDMQDGAFKYNNKLDILKLAVVERHRATGNIGLGLVEGFELKGGAIAQTIAHDSHNIIVIGDNDEDMLMAVNNVAEIGGGITICSGGIILKSLPLPIAGLMSNKPMEEIDEKLENMIKIAYEQLNVNTDMDPFITLSFLALPVIPEIKLTDMGLFNVNYFSFMDRCVEQ